MDEQRRIPRRRLAVYPEVVEIGSGETIGRLGDLTATGLMVVSDEAIETGVVLDLSIRLPEPLAGVTSIDFEARSLWSKAGANARVHETGFEFTRLSDGDRRNVSRLIMSYGLSR